jgi:hypothetical protein
MLAALTRRFSGRRYTVGWNRLQLRIEVEGSVPDRAKLQSELMALPLAPPTFDALARQLNLVGQQHGLVVTFDPDVARDRFHRRETIRVRIAAL